MTGSAAITMLHVSAGWIVKARFHCGTAAALSWIRYEVRWNWSFIRRSASINTTHCEAISYTSTQSTQQHYSIHQQHLLMAAYNLLHTERVCIFVRTVTYVQLLKNEFQYIFILQSYYDGCLTMLAMLLVMCRQKMS